jgi:hypothetical protein
LPFAFLFPFSLRRRGLFDIYICARSQLNNSTNGDLISGLKIAEYWRQVNPLMILRSAAFDVNPFDRARKQSAAPAPEPLAYARGTAPVSQHWRVITRDVMIPALWVLKSRAI